MFNSIQGFSASKDLEMKDRAEMEAYVSLVENSLLPAEVINFSHSLIMPCQKSLPLYSDVWIPDLGLCRRCTY